MAKKKIKENIQPDRVIHLEEGEVATFIDKDGRRNILLAFLKEDEVWEKEVKRTGKTKKIITYEGIRRLAREAGIYYFHKKKLYDPSIDNFQLRAFDVTIFCKKKEGVDCQHGFHMTTMVGSADDKNTANIGGNHKDTMAEKRGFCRAVIQHLGLVDIYSDAEMDEEEGGVQKKHDLKPSQFESLGPILNKILNCATKEELHDVGAEVNTMKQDMTPEQVEYLKKVYKDRLATLENANF